MRASVISRQKEFIVYLFAFVLIRLVIGLKNSRHFVIISGIKPTVTCSCPFSRSSLLPHVFVTSSDRFTDWSLFFVIGRNDYKPNQTNFHMKGFASDSGMAYYMGVFALHVFVSKPGRNLQNS